MTANTLSVTFDNGVVDRLINRKVPGFVKSRILFKIKLIDKLYSTTCSLLIFKMQTFRKSCYNNWYRYRRS